MVYGGDGGAAIMREHCSTVLWEGCLFWLLVFGSGQGSIQIQILTDDLGGDLRNLFKNFIQSRSIGIRSCVMTGTNLFKYIQNREGGV